MGFETIDTFGCHKGRESLAPFFGTFDGVAGGVERVGWFAFADGFADVFLDVYDAGYFAHVERLR